MATAFDGKIADQVFKAAANWRQSSQDAAFNEIAGKLTVSGEGDVLRGYALREYLLTSVKRCRPDYSNNEILNLFICVAQNFLTVFCGEPGSGKTSICNIIAHVLGTAKTADLVSDTKGIEIRRFKARFKSRFVKSKIVALMLTPPQPCEAAPVLRF